MPFERIPTPNGWSARIALGFAARGDATVLVRREHRGPLVVQKPLYPEGPGVCHAILVHPPSGLVGGDTLDVELALGASAHALITTPGAGKWYRSAGSLACQSVTAHLSGDAVLEWLPQEAIVYDGARASMSVGIALSRDATYVGMEILCLGRTASGERFRSGACTTSTRIDRAGEPIWLERGSLAGGDPLLDSPIGLDGQPVTGTLLAASPRLSSDLLAACRELHCPAGRCAITLLPGLLVARWLGASCEPARAWLAAVWGCLRPALAGQCARLPRIWNT